MVHSKQQQQSTKCRLYRQLLSLPKSSISPKSRYADFLMSTLNNQKIRKVDNNQDLNKKVTKIDSKPQSHLFLIHLIYYTNNYTIPNILNKFLKIP